MTRAELAALRRRLRDPARPLGYEEAKSLLAVEDAELRLRLAARPDAPQEVLYYLASDPAPAVRRAVAANPGTPIQAELILARDAKEEVRYALAEKVAQSAAERSADERPGRAKLFFELLKALARDELVRIRRLIARAIKDIANIPREIVRRLAQDDDPEVAAPVLEHSPVLREHDLLDAIGSAPPGPLVAAVARRDGVGAKLADAVVATGDEAGIAVLLANESAQIREETLDYLIDRAASVPAWQASLVERGDLSSAAAARLARQLAGPPAGKRASRGELDDESLCEMHAASAKGAAEPRGAARRRRATPAPREAAGPEAAPGDERLHSARPAPVALASSSEAAQRREPGRGAARAAGLPAEPKATLETAGFATERARAMLAAGELDEAAVGAALAARDRAFVVAALALKAKLPVPLANKILTVGGAKGITALVWRAGFGMRLAGLLQTRFAGIAPKKALHSKDGVAFPLSDDEMRWHLEFFGAV